jgi:hypothetical protein
VLPLHSRILNLRTVVTKLTLGLALLCVAAPLRPCAAQANPLFGTWATEKKIKDAPATVIVRPDSSASYGTETVRWRIRTSGKILLALGGEWVEYDYRVRSGKLVLSGGDLTEAITLRRTGNPTPRPANTPVPPDPDTEQ